MNTTTRHPSPTHPGIPGTTVLRDGGALMTESIKLREGVSWNR
jgi:hypothetical protein